jgi:uncharacterized protein
LIAVSDSSPLITLAKLSRLDLLLHIFPAVTISHEVREEITGRGENRAGSAEIASATWIQVRAVEDQSPMIAAAQAFNLGFGETSAIFLAKQLRADVVLIDETKARKVAAALEIPVVGCIGLLERMHVRGLITDLRADFGRLSELSYVHVDLLNSRLRALNLPAL